MILLVDDDLGSTRHWIGLIEDALKQPVRRTDKVQIAYREAAEQSTRLIANGTRDGMFKLAILDVMMRAPGENEWVPHSQGGAITGLVLAQRLRALRGFEKIPIIFLTAQSDESVVWDLKEFPQPSANFNKGSVMPDDLLDQIREFLRLQP